MAHFEVYGKEYPMVGRNEFRFSDWALVREATGLGSEEWILAHGVAEGDTPDQLVLFGYAAVAFWHGNPGMTRSRVGAEIESWTDSDVTFAADKNEESDDAVPLDGANDGSPSSEESSQTSDGSNSTPGSPSGTMIPNDGGQLGSPVGAPA